MPRTVSRAAARQSTIVISRRHQLERHVRARPAVISLHFIRYAYLVPAKATADAKKRVSVSRCGPLPRTPVIDFVLSVVRTVRYSLDVYFAFRPARISSRNRPLLLQSSRRFSINARLYAWYSRREPRSNFFPPTAPRIAIGVRDGQRRARPTCRPVTTSITRQAPWTTIFSELPFFVISCGTSRVRHSIRNGSKRTEIIEPFKPRRIRS